MERSCRWVNAVHREDQEEAEYQSGVVLGGRERLVDSAVQLLPLPFAEHKHMIIAVLISG